MSKLFPSARLQDQWGSAMIETVVAAPLVGLVIATGSFLLYLAFAKTWIARAAREGAICLVGPKSRSTCQRRVDRTLAAGLPLGTYRIDTFRADRDRARVKIGYRLRSNEDEARFSVEVELPLGHWQ